MSSDDRIEAVFAQAARVAHPTRSDLNLLRNRVTELEDRIALLTKRFAAMSRLLDLLAEADGGE